MYNTFFFLHALSEHSYSKILMKKTNEVELQVKKIKIKVYFGPKQSVL